MGILHLPLHIVGPSYIYEAHPGGAVAGRRTQSRFVSQEEVLHTRPVNASIPYTAALFL
jgi:hypothetical protein